MVERIIPFHDPAFEMMLDRAARASGFSGGTLLAARLAALGALEDLDWFLLRDITGLGKVTAAEAVLLLVLLLQARNRGSLCLSTAPAHLAGRLDELGPELPDPGAGQRLAAWLGEAPPALLSHGAAAAAPLVLDPATGLLYFQRLFLAETSLKELLAKRLALPAADPDPATCAALLRAVLETNAPRRNGKPVVPNSEQRLAVLCALRRPLTLVSGGPGTGKTSMVAALLRCLVHSGVRAEAIHLAAPTGRAAQRLADAIRQDVESVSNPMPHDRSVLAIDSTTIHKLLAPNRRTGSFRYNRTNPLPLDCLVVDEASMLSADLAACLLDALPADCRLVLIGDRDQLPSVEAGAVLGDLLPATPAFSKEFAAFAKLAAGLAVTPGGSGRFQDSVVFLQQSYRSQPGILDFAASVNRGRAAAASLPVLEPGTAPVWAGLDASAACLRTPLPESPAERERLCEAWIVERMMECRVDELGTWETLLAAVAATPVDALRNSDHCRALFRRLGAARILTALRHGTPGCETLNRRLAARMKERFDPEREGPLFHGLPVLVKENNQSRKLFNGDIGIVVRAPGDVSGRNTYRVVFDRPQELPVLTPDELPAWEPAFAITVHKSQGSEYDEVLLLMPAEAGHTLNTREILYTGITRARKRAVIMGENAVIDAAARTPAQRESGLRLWSAGS